MAETVESESHHRITDHMITFYNYSFLNRNLISDWTNNMYNSYTIIKGLFPFCLSMKSLASKTSYLSRVGAAFQHPYWCPVFCNILEYDLHPHCMKATVCSINTSFFCKCCTFVSWNSKFLPLKWYWSLTSLVWMSRCHFHSLCILLYFYWS